MNREQAEKLLGALIFDDLDEPAKAELLAYLQTDDELRDRLTDMRMAVKLTCDAVNDGPDPVLSEQRLEQLKRLAKSRRNGLQVSATRHLLAVAAVLAFGLVLVGFLMPRLSKVRYSRRSDSPRAASSPAQSLSERSASDSTRRFGGIGGMGGVASETSNGYGGGGMGMMGGMAGQGIRNSAPAAGGSYGGAVMDQEVSRRYVVNSDAPSATRIDGSSSSRRIGDRDPDILERYRLGWEPTVLDQQSQVAKDAFKSPEIDLSQLGAQSEPPMRPTGGIDAGQKVDYAWSGTVSAGKPINMFTPAPMDSKETADEQPAPASPVAGPVAADKRVPVLGDVPIIGAQFRRGQELSAEALRELRSMEERSSNRPSIVSGKAEAEQRLREVVAADGDGLPPQSRFAVVPVNPWVMTERDPLSTFALDVDTASYALCRRYIRSGFLPPIAAVRMEEFINAFDYGYSQRDDATFAVYAEGAPSPFAPEGRDLTLLKIAVKARTVGRDQRRAAHLVFVVDASASMGQPDRLPQVQAAMSLLVDKLSEVDRVSLITCANDARLHLEAVPAREKDTIRRTIEAIQPAGSTNLLAGLKLGYAMARRAFVAGRINQVVLCSDGVANVGQTEAEAVLQEVADDRKQGITLTCVGVGYGVYNDAFLEAMADRGDGRYVFLDASEQAREALVGQLAATLQTVAKDARIQVQFNPARVRRYRLIGYENRDIEDERFRDDTVDAGEVGSGQCSTALYEVELTSPRDSAASDLGVVFVRYRHAETEQIEEISRSLAGSIVRRRSVEEDPRFFLAAGAARFAEWLRQSEHARDTDVTDVQMLLDEVSAALPLDQDVQDLAALAHQAQGLPRAAQSQP